MTLPPRPQTPHPFLTRCSAYQSSRPTSPPPSTSLLSHPSSQRSTRPPSSSPPSSYPASSRPPTPTPNSSGSTPLLVLDRSWLRFPNSHAIDNPKSPPIDHASYFPVLDRTWTSFPNSTTVDYGISQSQKWQSRRKRLRYTVRKFIRKTVACLYIPVVAVPIVHSPQQGCRRVHSGGFPERWERWEDGGRCGCADGGVGGRGGRV